MTIIKENFSVRDRRIRLNNVKLALTELAMKKYILDSDELNNHEMLIQYKHVIHHSHYIKKHLNQLMVIKGDTKHKNYKSYIPKKLIFTINDIVKQIFCMDINIDELTDLHIERCEEYFNIDPGKKQKKKWTYMINPNKDALASDFSRIN